MRQRTENRTVPHGISARLDGGAPNRLRDRVRRFATREDGSLIVFAVYVFVIILMFGGIGIDLMRFERDRANIQYTMDRAVLAAADTDQSLPPKEVVEDYLEKAGMGDFLASVTVEDGMGYRIVSATASTDIKTQFMHMSGVDTLTAPAASTAEESIGGVEISLVLDVSGSMNSYSRLKNMKVAAKDFVKTVLASSNTGSISISVIPYATQVGVGESLLSKYVVSDEHNYSHCVNFTSDEFSKTYLSTEVELERTAHFDVSTYSEMSLDGELKSPVCPTDEDLQILPLSNDEDELVAYIDALTAGGNTSIDLGAKWGTVLLDPSTQGVVSSLIDDGEINPAFEGRPYNYDNGDTLKILILMTDGQNTNQYMLNPSYRDGMSDVWYNAAANRYSVQRSKGKKTEYWWPLWNSSVLGILSSLAEEWNDHPYGEGALEIGESVQLSFPELWNRTSLAWNAEYNYAFQGNRWSAWYSNAYYTHNGTAKDAHTKQMCRKAKTAGIVVFSVGFEAPSSGVRVLQECASSDSHYFDVEGLDIVDAFASIASSISKLRLTQ